MSVPALTYGLQNCLYWVSLSYLSATSYAYQLWAQSKTLFTALFFVVYLGRRLAAQQWLALCVAADALSLAAARRSVARSGLSPRPPSPVAVLGPVTCRGLSKKDSLFSFDAL